MKSVFTAKYLQHLNSKKNKEGGFTLIELLVVIIIVGVLAAIALPSFLNQIGKARGSEAKATIGTINRSQQAYRLENNQFSDDLDLLDAQINGKFYLYSINDQDQNNASVQTTANQDDLKLYSAYVSQAGDTFTQTICESTATAAATDDSEEMDNSDNTCGDLTGYKEVQ